VNRWHPTPEQRRVLWLLGVLGPLSALQITRALAKDATLTNTTLYQMHRAGWLTHVAPTACQRYESQNHVRRAYAPSARAQLHLRGQWLTRPGRHLIALSELVDGTFRDCEAFILNRSQPVLSIEAAALAAP